MNYRLVVVGVITRGDEVLVGQKAPGRGPYPDTWHIPGGGVELDVESVDEAILREVSEECGIRVEIASRIGFDEDIEPDKHGKPTRYVFLSYMLTYKSGEAQASDDMQVLKWVNRHELATLNLNRPSRKLFTKLGFI